MCDKNYKTYSAQAVANFILGELPSMGVADATNMKMQKLVYFAHGFMLGIKRQPLVEDSFEAWTYGPVCLSLYESLKRYGTSPVPGSIRSNDVIPGDSPAAEVIRKMLGMLAKFTAGQLVSLSHDKEGPWATIWARNGKYAIIPNWLIMDYFTRELTEA